MNIRISTTLALTILLIIGCGRSEKIYTETEQIKLRQVFTDFVKEIEAGNTDGFFSYITDDYLEYYLGEEPVTNLDTLRSMLDDFFAINTFTLTDHRSEEVIIRDDVAIHRHRGTISIKPKADTTVLQLDVKYLDVLRKNKNGEWKIYIHSVNESK